MHGRERGGNCYQRGMSHDNVLCVAAIAAEARRQLIFTEMKKPSAARFAVLTIPTQSADAYALTALPDIGYPVPLAGNKPDDFMSRYTAGLALLRRSFRVPEIGTAYSACFNFDKTSSGPGAGIGRFVISSTPGATICIARYFLFINGTDIIGIIRWQGRDL